MTNLHFRGWGFLESGNIDDRAASLLAIRVFEHFPDSSLGGDEQRRDVKTDHRIDIKALQARNVASQPRSIGQIANYRWLLCGRDFRLAGR